MSESDGHDLIEKGFLLMEEVRWQEASELWRSVRIKFPERAEGYIQGGVAYRELGCIDEALLLFNESIKQHPHSPGNIIQKGLTLMQEKQWKTASDLWGSVRIKFPDRAEGYIQGGVAYRELGCIDEALYLFNESIKQHPHSPGNVIQKGLTLMQEKQWRKANELWGSVRTKFPERAEGYIQGGVTYRELGCIDEALHLFNESIKQHPNSPGNIIQKGFTLMQEKQWKKASNLWDELRNQFPERAEGYTQGRIAHRELGCVLFDESIKKYPDNSTAIVQKGFALMGAKKWKDASELWEEVRIKFPDLAVGCIQGGIAYRERGRIDEALFLFDESIKKHPDNPNNLIQKGLTLY